MTSVVLFGTGAGIAFTFFNMLTCQADADGEPQSDNEAAAEEAEAQDVSLDSETPEPSTPTHSNNINKWWLYGGLAAASILAALGVCVMQRHGKRKREHRRDAAIVRASYGRGPGSRPDPDVRIPLRDVIRFKERQWFVEELEAARDGDANAMLRLSKMYLNGQGCDVNASMANEWLRKARSLGVFATLDELYATDVDTPTKRERIREMIALEQQRRQARRSGPADA